VRFLFAVVILVSSAACGGIDTGNVGVRKSFFGQVSSDEEQPGFYWAVFDSVSEYSGKEIQAELDDMTPKAKDNLSLQDMDVSVYYRVAPGRIADVVTKYAGQDAKVDGVRYPCFNLVLNLARGATYDQVARIESLKMHTQRDEIAAAIRESLQAQLDGSDPATFVVTRVVIQSVKTDKSIEQSIQQAIARQKELEAMTTRVEIAAKDAEVKIAEAKGVAEANHIINKSLTREYLQHEANQVLMKFAEGDNASTVVIPANMQTAPLLNIGK
jgi:regulator of protease activity HflC (stomatin/prohibitin superfamily)